MPVGFLGCIKRAIFGNTNEQYKEEICILMSNQYSLSLSLSLFPPPPPPPPPPPLSLSLSLSLSLFRHFVYECCALFFLFLSLPNFPLISLSIRNPRILTPHAMEVGSKEHDTYLTWDLPGRENSQNLVPRMSFLAPCV